MRNNYYMKVVSPVNDISGGPPVVSNKGLSFAKMCDLVSLVEVWWH